MLYWNNDLHLIRIFHFLLWDYCKINIVDKCAVSCNFCPSWINNKRTLISTLNRTIWTASIFSDICTIITFFTRINISITAVKKNQTFSKDQAVSCHTLKAVGVYIIIAFDTTSLAGMLTKGIVEKIMISLTFYTFIFNAFGAAMKKITAKFTFEIRESSTVTCAFGAVCGWQRAVEAWTCASSSNESVGLIVPISGYTCIASKLSILRWDTA